MCRRASTGPEYRIGARRTNLVQKVVANLLGIASHVCEPSRLSCFTAANPIRSMVSTVLLNPPPSHASNTCTRSCMDGCESKDSLDASNVTTSAAEESEPVRRDTMDPVSPRLKSSTLPFSIRIVRNEEQLARAVNIRAEAYERHWPNLYGQLKSPEAQDRDPNSLVFLAESKSNGQPVGTMRVDTNLFSELPFGSSVELPTEMQGQTIAYITRLGVKQGASGSVVKLALFKSLHRYCLAKQLAWMLVGIRPPGDRDYVRLGFTDINKGGEPVPIGSSGGIPVRLMAFEVNSAERIGKEAAHPLYKFMFLDFHPDIEIFSSVSGMWTRPRKAPVRLREDVDIYNEFGLPLV